MMTWPSRPGVVERISQKRRGVAVLISSARMSYSESGRRYGVVRWWDYGVIVLRRLPTRILCRGSAWISQQAVATHTQRTSGNLEDLHFTLLDVVVDGASVCIDNLCGGRYPDDLHVLTTTGAPDLLPLYQRMVCFVHSVLCGVR